MKIHIINWEEGINKGILSKFSYKMFDELNKIKGVQASISGKPNLEADINHHVNYLPYKGPIEGYKGKNTLNITHIWEGYKLDSLRKGMESADMGICMSRDTKEQLIKWGLPMEKLATVLPAHDGKPRRYQVVAILTNVYPDGCKRAEMLTELVKTLDKNRWAFRIMGSGWVDILTPLVADGLQVDLFNDFDEKIHQQILETSDYCLYFGQDEGSMAILDAANAGLKTISTPQGFHKEIGLDYEFNTQEELNEIFKKLSVNEVEGWTWAKYVKDHMKIWKLIMK